MNDNKWAGCLLIFILLFVALGIVGYYKTRPPQFPDVPARTYPPRPAPLSPNKDAAAQYSQIKRGVNRAQGLSYLHQGTLLPYQAAGPRGEQETVLFIAELGVPSFGVTSEILTMLRRFSLQGSQYARGQAVAPLTSLCDSLPSRFKDASVAELEQLRAAAQAEPVADIIDRLGWERDDALDLYRREDLSYVRRGLEWELAELREGRQPDNKAAMDYGMWWSVVVALPGPGLITGPMKAVHGSDFLGAVRYYTVSNSLRLSGQFASYRAGETSLTALRQALDKELARRKVDQGPP